MRLEAQENLLKILREYQTLKLELELLEVVTFLKGPGYSETITIATDRISHGSHSLREKRGKFLGKFVESVSAFQLHHVKPSFKEEFHPKE